MLERDQSITLQFFSECCIKRSCQWKWTGYYSYLTDYVSVGFSRENSLYFPRLPIYHIQVWKRGIKRYLNISSWCNNFSTVVKYLRIFCKVLRLRKIIWTRANYTVLCSLVHKHNETRLFFLNWTLVFSSGFQEFSAVPNFVIPCS